MTDARDLVPALLGQYEFELTIRTSTDQLWAALTRSVDGWWLPDFRILGAGSQVRLQPVSGGRLWEETPDGSGLEWYRVQMVEPKRSLGLVGTTAPRWGGPLLSMLELRVEAGEDGARLLVQDSLMGKVDRAQLESLEAGWRELFGQGLAPFVEART